jgi:flagellar assembly protein FliH
VVEETISLSKVIKSLQTPNLKQESKKIIIRNLFEEGIYNQVDENRATDQSNYVESKENRQERLEMIEAEMEEAHKKANQLILEAEEEAKRILEQVELERRQAQLDIEQLKQEATEQGYQDGFTQGQNEGFRSYSSLIEQAHAIIAQSELEYEKTIESAEPVIVELATALANRMVDQQLDVNPEIWASLLKQVMSEVREHENVRIYVHPDWFERTSHQKEELEQLLSHTENLFIYPDAGLMSNGCVIESKYGRIEASVDKQLEELKTQLLVKLKEDENERTSAY